MYQVSYLLQDRQFLLQVDEDLEESARFYESDNGEIHLRSDFLIDDAEGPRNLRVAFIVKNGVLFSVLSTGETLTIEHNSIDRSCFMPGITLSARKVVEINQLIYGLENII